MDLQDITKKRSSLLGNVDKITEYITASKNKNLDAEDLFGDSSLVQLNLRKDTNPKSTLEILLMERESLGVYMHGNPLKEFTSMLECLRTYLGLKKFLHLILIEKSRKIFTKSQGIMFGLDIIDSFYADIDGVIYTKNAAKYSGIIEDKNLYWVIGKIMVPKKVEIDEETDGVENQMEEKTKLVVDHICNYQSGLIEFLRGSDKWNQEIEISQFANLNWENVKNNPNGVNWDNLCDLKITGGLYDKAMAIEDSNDGSNNSSKEKTPKQNNKKNILVFRDTVSSHNLKLIKSQLKKEKTSDTDIKIEVIVEKNGKSTIAKIAFYIDTNFYDQLDFEYKNL